MLIALKLGRQEQPPEIRKLKTRKTRAAARNPEIKEMLTASAILSSSVET